MGRHRSVARVVAAPAGLAAAGKQKLVKQFDKDGDKRLNAAERQAALEFLQKERAEGRGAAGPRRAARGAWWIWRSRRKSGTSAARPETVARGCKARFPTRRFMTRKPCAPSSSNSKTPIGKRNSRVSKTPTSKCRRS